MRNHRSDVVATAMRVLDDHGLGDLTMRRLAGELGVQPSALYHHVANKQTLLGLVADELLLRRAAPDAAGPWRDQVVTACTWLRDALLAWRDGAELVTTVHAFGLGGSRADEVVGTAVQAAGLDGETATTATRTLLHYTFGHTLEEQTRLQAASAGAIDEEPADRTDFAEGLALIIDGIGVAQEATGASDSNRSHSATRAERSGAARSTKPR